MHGPNNSTDILATHPITITVLDGRTVTSIHTTTLNLPFLALTVRQAYIFPDLTSSSLIFTGQLCNAGCQPIFITLTVAVTHNNTTVQTGHNTTTGLWQLHLPVPTAPLHANLSTLIIQTTQGRVAFLHVAAGYPSTSTWI